MLLFKHVTFGEFSRIACVFFAHSGAGILLIFSEELKSFPPNLSFSSTITTLAPVCAAQSADINPAGPAPTISKSQ